VSRVARRVGWSLSVIGLATLAALPFCRAAAPAPSPLPSASAESVLGTLDRTARPASLAGPRTPVLAAPERIAIPDGERGIGFDDLQYAPGLGRILVPAGRTGHLLLLDPATRALLPIGGFSATAAFHGGHSDGTTSAVELEGQPGKLVATDRGSRTLSIVDAKAKRLIASVTLAGAPDYVRCIPSLGQVWVTEPGKKEIEVLAEVFPIDGKSPAGLLHLGTIPVPGGPESLVVDTGRGRAYTHTWKDQSYAIDLPSRRIVATWTNGCQRARGIGLDGKRGFLFVGCAEGRATVLDVTSGKLLSSAAAGADVDSVAYSATLGHLYVPGGGAADLSIFAVSSRGALVLLGKVPTAADAHTAAFDPVTSTVFVGDPEHGVVLAIPDPFPSSL
jgi:hypothetical protein